jgi:hypothetical protein
LVTWYTVYISCYFQNILILPLTDEESWYNVEITGYLQKLFFSKSTRVYISGKRYHLYLHLII